MIDSVFGKGCAISIVRNHREILIVLNLSDVHWSIKVKSPPRPCRARTGLMTQASNILADFVADISRPVGTLLAASCAGSVQGTV